MEQNKSLSYAVIHVGSSTMSLNIVEYRKLNDIKIIESITREVTYGEELFQTKRLSFDTIREMCRVLKGYREIMTAYGITEYRAVATSVIREAENRRHIIDQIFVQSGIEIEVLDMPQEIYLKYFALYRNVHALGLMQSNESTLFLDVTSGGLGLALWHSDTLMYQQNMHIGTIRVLESFNRHQRSSPAFARAVEELLQSTLHPIVREINKFSIKYLVLSGEEARWIAEMMGISNVHDNVIIEPKTFQEFYDTFDGISPTKLMNRYHMPEHRANILMPLMIIYHEILNLISVPRVCINNTTFREGLIICHGASLAKSPYITQMRWQTLKLARAIATRYHYDVGHSEQIELFGTQILEAMSTRGGLKERSLFLFKMIAILFGVGMHINMRSRNEQSYSIIQGTDFFGLTEMEKQVVASAAYYANGDNPKEEDYYFKQLSEIQKMATIKLIAIFRLARALDKSHLQKISYIDVIFASNVLRIIAHSKEDLSLERWTFEEDAKYFGEVFGVSVELEQRR